MLLKKYIAALTNLYGMFHKDKLLEIYNAQNREQITMDDIDVLMENELEVVADTYAYPYQDYFAHEVLVEFEECDLLLREKGSKPYYVPDKKELLKYADSFYFEETPAYKAFYRYIKKSFFPDDAERARVVCEEAQLGLHMNDPVNSILEDLIRMGVVFKDPEQLGEGLNLLTDFGNNVRLWENNGHTPREVFEKYEKPHMSPLPEKSFDDRETNVIDFRTRKKIGRNDPCLCGSGKKFKKCCLKKES